MEATNNANFTTNNETSNKKATQSREYDFQIKDDNYKLIIDIYSNEAIRFHVKQTNRIVIEYYEKEYTYDEITNTLKLVKNHYDNINKVFNFYNTAIEKKKVILIEQKENKQVVLKLERELDFDIIQTNIELKHKQINNDEMIKILADEINKLKTYQIQTEQKNYEQKIKTNEETIENLQLTINKIENERVKEKQELKQIQTKQKDYEQTIQNLQQTINKIETEKANEKE